MFAFDAWGALTVGVDCAIGNVCDAGPRDSVERNGASVAVRDQPMHGGRGEHEREQCDGVARQAR